MKKLISLALAFILCAFALVSCDKKDSDTVAQTHIAPAADEIDLSTIGSIDGVTEADEPTDYVLINVQGYGQIVIRLFPAVAPETVENFKSLVSEKFYDGLIFHRVISGFMIQGGDPRGNGTGGSDKTIKGEFSENGFENNLGHVRGVVAMARSNDKNSASSQFYISHKTSGVESLDGKYATFGFVVYGIDVVDKIAKVSTNSSDKPLKDVVMTSVRFVNITE